MAANGNESVEMVEPHAHSRAHTSYSEYSSARLLGFQTTTCVVCHTTAPQQPKLLTGCLHTVCRKCLQDVPINSDGVCCPRCQRTSSFPLGASVLDAFPDDCLAAKKLAIFKGSSSEYGQADGAETRMCDDCVVDEAESADVYCGQCRLLLCKFHAHSHARTRQTAAHDLHRLDSALTSRSLLHTTVTTSPKCLLHPSKTLSRFCETCRELLCERCEEQGKHRSKASSATSPEDHVVVDSDAAGEKERAKLAECMERGDMSDCIDSLEKRVKHARRMMAIVDEESEKESQKITSAINRLVELLRADEKRLLAEVDAIRWRKLRTLEPHEVGGLEALETAERSRQLAAEALKSFGAKNLLQISNGLLRGMEEAQMSAKIVCPTVCNHVTFVSWEKEIEESIAGGVGAVVDTDVCVEKSAFDCPEMAWCGEEVSFTLSLRNAHGECFPRECLQSLSATVSVSTAVDTTEEGYSGGCVEIVKLSMASDDNLSGSFALKTTGLHTVQVFLNDQTLMIPNTPARLTVQEGTHFLPSMCTPNVSLSDENRTVKKNDRESSHAVAFFSTGFVSGEQSWRLHVSTGDNSPSYELGAGVHTSMPGSLSVSADDAYTIALTFTNYSDVRDGDTLVLTIDCEARKITLQVWRDDRQLKEQTRIAKQLSSEERFFPFVYLWGKNDCFTILPSH